LVLQSYQQHHEDWDGVIPWIFGETSQLEGGCLPEKILLTILADKFSRHVPRSLDNGR
jgi:hypothetical protein